MPKNPEIVAVSKGEAERSGIWKWIDEAQKKQTTTKTMEALMG